jgi:hypothetical protein
MMTQLEEENFRFILRRQQILDRQQRWLDRRARIGWPVDPRYWINIQQEFEILIRELVRLLRGTEERLRLRVETENEKPRRMQWGRPRTLG